MSKTTALPGKAWLWQLIRFGIVGAFNTLLTNGIYWLLLAIQVNTQLAWVLGYFVGMVASLLLNKQWTFRQREGIRAMQTVRFVVINLVALAVSTALLSLFEGPLGVPEKWAGLLATPFSMLVNFLGNKLWVFRSDSR